MLKIDYTQIGSHIRDARKALGLTQEAAAERCDITASYYGNLERGSRKMSLETLIKISYGLNISADTILFGNNPHTDQLDKLLHQIRKSSDDAQFKKYLSIIKAVSGIVDDL